MKMADGGFRPAYNLEIATDVDSQVIVGVAVVTKGSDGGEAVPMAEQVAARLGHSPAAYLLDGGFGPEEAAAWLQAEISLRFGATPPDAEVQAFARSTEKWFHARWPWVP